MAALTVYAGRETIPPAALEWAVASRPLAGETSLGDMCLVHACGDRFVLAVADGLGHGEPAAAAAHRTIATLRHYCEEPIDSLIRHCHERLLGTRGVVLSVAAIDPAGDSITWAGVGNVECRLLRVDETAAYQRESLMLRGGVVGYRLPSVRRSETAIASGDLVVMATDGISSGFDAGLDPLAEPQRIADAILANKGKLTDDALVLVVRYLGTEGAGSLARDAAGDG